MKSSLTTNETMEPNQTIESKNVSKDRKLSKRDSSMSMVSSCSIESDWSDDEELEELEKMFGSIQHKSSMAETTTSGWFPTYLKKSLLLNKSVVFSKWEQNNC